MGTTTSLWIASKSRQSQRFRRARRRLFYGCVRSLAATVETVPRPAAVGTLRGLAELAWRTRPGDRSRILSQLQRAFPELSDSERRRMGRASLHALAGNLVSAVRADETISIDAADSQRLDELLAAARPVLFLTAHLSCWEALGRYLAARSGGLGVVTANPHNRAVYEWLKQRRQEHGLVVFDRDRPLAAARWLARGRPLAVLGDLRTRGAQVDAPWFGAEAPTTQTPVRWAQRFAARLVPAGIRREGVGHRVWLEEEIDVDDLVTDRHAAARCNAALMQMIRRAPEEWIWMHDRYGRSEAQG